MSYIPPVLHSDTFDIWRQKTNSIGEAWRIKYAKAYKIYANRVISGTSATSILGYNNVYGRATIVLSSRNFYKSAYKISVVSSIQFANNVMDPTQHNILLISYKQSNGTVITNEIQSIKDVAANANDGNYEGIGYTTVVNEYTKIAQQTGFPTGNMDIQFDLLISASTDITQIYPCWLFVEEYAA